MTFLRPPCAAWLKSISSTGLLRSFCSHGLKSIERRFWPGKILLLQIRHSWSLMRFKWSENFMRMWLRITRVISLISIPIWGHNWRELGFRLRGRGDWYKKSDTHQFRLFPHRQLVNQYTNQPNSHHTCQSFWFRERQSDQPSPHISTGQACLKSKILT